MHDVTDDLFRIGVITSTHGLAGEVKVFPTTQDPQRYRQLDKALIATDQGYLTVHAQRVRFFKQYVIVKFKEMSRIEDVEPYVKKELYVTREDAIPLEEGEYYVADLLGLKVVTDDGTWLGEVDDVLQTGANDVYVVKNPEREILIPAIEECILERDLAEGVMKVHLLKGLL